MRLSFNFLFALLLSTTAVNATVIVNPPEPYPQSNSVNNIIDFAGNSTGTITSGTMNTGKGYRAFLNTNTDTIYVDVKSDTAFTVPADGHIGVTLVHGGGSLITLTGAQEISIGLPRACDSLNCFGTDNTAAIYPGQNRVLRLSFTMAQLCASGSSDLCSNRATFTNQRYTSSIAVRFAVVTSLTSGGNVTSSTTNVDTGNFTLAISDIAPKLTDTTCPTNFYFPGDTEIFFYQSLFTSASPGVGAGPLSSTGAGIQYLIAMAKEGGADDAPGGLTSNTVVGYAAYGQSLTTLTGFTNTTTGPVPGGDHQYDMKIVPQNRAGIIADSADAAQGATCNGVQSQNISGILKESKCFIATAAYHDGRAAPVMMLREFRDQILSKFSVGQKFIQTYYEYSPALAEWAWDKPIIRSFALKVLAPIELMAWAILKMTSAQEVVPSESSQPYIDRLKSTLPPEENPSSGSFTEQEKKRLDAEQKVSPVSNESYVERLKKEMGDDTTISPTDYTEKEKAKLPPEVDRESPITMVKEGRDRKLGLGETPPIMNAAGVKIGVVPGMAVTVAGSAHSFTDVYGGGYQPELIFHYERQFFHSENFGSLGAGIDFGVAYSGGNGLLQFGANGSFQSRTGFGFYQVPTILHAIYRFNLFRILRPYISAGAGSIAFTETRSDSKGDKRGISAVYSTNLGVAFLMDFLDAGTHRDSYLATGIQHTYLFVEYVYLNTFSANVMFKRAGLYSGFTFEF